MQPPPRPPRDAVSKLQSAVIDVCGLYKNALGNIQNEADRLLVTNAKSQSPLQSMTSVLADEIVGAHHEIERQAEALERTFRSEDEQLQRLLELQESHEAVTQELRTCTEAAERAHTSLAEQLDGLMDGMLEINGQHRVAIAAAEEGRGLSLI